MESFSFLHGIPFTPDHFHAFLCSSIRNKTQFFHLTYVYDLLGIINTQIISDFEQAFCCSPWTEQRWAHKSSVTADFRTHYCTTHSYLWYHTQPCFSQRNDALSTFLWFVVAIIVFNFSIYGWVWPLVLIANSVGTTLQWQTPALFSSAMTI